MGAIPTVVEIKHQKPDVIIYTDAATSTGVVAACVLYPETSKSQEAFSRTNGRDIETIVGRGT